MPLGAAAPCSRSAGPDRCVEADRSGTRVISAALPPTPLRLLITADAVGGVFSYVVSLVRELSKWGVESVVATMGPAPSAAQRADLLEIPRVTLLQSSFALEWMESPWQGVDAAGEWLLGIEQRVKPDVIHLNGYCHAALPWTAPTLVAAHSCVLSWWRGVFGSEAPDDYSLYRERVTAGLARADRVVAPSRAMARAVQDLYAPPSPTSVIYNGVDSKSFQPTSKEPFFLAAGRLWDPAKNLASLRRAAPQLRWPVRVAGEPGNGSSRSEEGLDPLGQLRQAELWDCMSRAAVFLHPARYEPFGLCVLEAAMSGCALILGDIASLREIWGDTALYADPDDSDALVAHATRLASATELRASLAERARRRAARYSVALTAAQYLKAYRELVARRREAQPGTTHRDYWPRPRPARQPARATLANGNR
jgi:glycogen synthase